MAARPRHSKTPSPSPWLQARQGRYQPPHAIFLAPTHTRRSSKAKISEDEEGNIQKEYSTKALGVLGPGNYFGEISILTNTRCRATLSTESKCMLLKVLTGPRVGLILGQSTRFRLRHTL